MTMASQQIRLPARLYADLIGKPYQPGARGPDAFDCLGLHLELLRRQGYDVPDYGSSMASFHLNFDGPGGILGVCREIELPVPGCTVLLRTGSNVDERHIGTMLDSFTMLHTMRETRSVVTEKVISPVWRHRVLGYYLPVKTEAAQ